MASDIFKNGIILSYTIKTLRRDMFDITSVKVI